MQNTSSTKATVDCDVVVIGAGVAGLAAAYFLSSQAHVVVLERESQPGYHSSGRSASLYIEGYENPIVAALTAQSGPFFRQAPSSNPILHDRGGLTVAIAGEEHVLQKYLETWQPFCPALRPVDADECHRLCPILSANGVIGGAYDPDWKSIDTHELMQCYQQGLKANGGQLLTNNEFLAATETNSGWRVTTTSYEVNSTWIVNASGAWANATAQIAGLDQIDLTPMRRTAVMVEGPPEVERWPVVHAIKGNLYFKPESPGLMVCPQDEIPSVPMDAFPDDMDIAIALDNFNKLVDYPVSHIKHSWAGLRTFTSDRFPVLGPDPRSERFFWLAGQGGFGVQTSPALGKKTADAILSGVPIDTDINRRRLA